MNMSYDSSNLTTPDIKWLGVRPSDLDRFNIPQQCRLPMTDEDIKTGKRLVRRLCSDYPLCIGQVWFGAAGKSAVPYNQPDLQTPTLQGLVSCLVPRHLDKCLCNVA